MNMVRIISVVAASLVSVGVSAATVKDGKYTIDSAHSRVGFEISHLVISTVDGSFKDVRGDINLKEKFEKSSVKTTVEMASIDTGVTKRDDHLRSPDFFDVKKYPKMTFESTEIKGTPESFKMTGKLNLHGVTKPVTFDGKYLGSVNDGMGNEKVAFTATAEIKRADFGLGWNKVVEAGPVVGDTAKIILKVEAGRPVQAKK
jgi:polyisoprenoid-binding protein YceI